MKQQKEPKPKKHIQADGIDFIPCTRPKPLTLKERRKIAGMVIVLIIAGIIVFGLIDLLFPIN